MPAADALAQNMMRINQDGVRRLHVVTTEPSEETMPDHGPNRGSRNTNALAVVAGALIALIAVLAFLAVISHRGGAQEWPGAAGAEVGYAMPAGIGAQPTVS